MTQQLLSPEQIRDGIKRFSHWNYAWDFGNGMVTAPNDPGNRVQELRNRYVFDSLEKYIGRLNGLSVIDIGCSEGAFAVEAKRRGARYVLGVEPREDKVEQARFIANALGLKDIEYKTINIWDISPETTGEFDVVLFTGVLHHLERPLESLRILRKITKKVMVVESQIVAVDYPIIALKEEGVEITTNSFDSSLVSLVSAKALRMMLSYSGFENVISLPKPTEAGWRGYKLGRRYMRGMHGAFIAFPSVNNRIERKNILRTGHEEVHGDLFCSYFKPTSFVNGLKLALIVFAKRLPRKIYHIGIITRLSDGLGLTGSIKKIYNRILLR